MHTIGLHHVFAPIALSVYPICIMCFMKTRELLLLLALTATTGMQAQRIKGSDTVLPIAQQTAERFMTLNPSARVTVTGGGTGVGISALLDQTTDIAMASRAIKFSEKMKIKGAGEESRRSDCSLRCSCRGGASLQSGKAADPPTTGRYLRAKSPTGSKWAETTAKS